MAERTHRFGSAAGAVLLVILGAGLALVADEWRDARERADRAAVMTDSIHDELSANSERVAAARSRHLQVIETLEAHAARDEVPAPEVYLGGLFNPALVGSTAWETARETGILGELPLDLVLELATVYEEQQRYRALGDAMVTGIMTDVRRDGMDVVLRDRFTQFIPLARDFSNREHELLDSYRAVLERIGSR